MIKVGIADDHAIFRQGLSELLSGDGRVRLAGTASDGREALELARSLGDGVLILDISMPVMDGLEVARKVRDEGLPVRLVLLSMHNDPVVVRKAYELGVEGFVLKEEAFGDLLSAVETAWRGSRFFSPKALALLAGGDIEGPRDPLSPREREVAARIAKGLTTKEIAEALSISPKTVETHRQRIMEKLGFHKAAEIAAYAVKTGIAD
jgi:DNA-binding NarL/FixJ family response regulator